MNRRILLAGMLGLALVAPAAAHEFQVGDITISHPWIRLNITSRPSAAYMGLINHGDAEDRLLRVSSEAFGRVEIHSHMLNDGVMSMARLDDLAVPPNGVVAFESGKYHLMLFEPTAALEPGDYATMTLSFERAGDVEIGAVVVGLGEEPGAESTEHDGHMTHDDATN